MLGSDFALHQYGEIQDSTQKITAFAQPHKWLSKRPEVAGKIWRETVYIYWRPFCHLLLIQQAMDSYTDHRRYSMLGCLLSLVCGWYNSAGIPYNIIFWNREILFDSTHFIHQHQHAWRWIHTIKFL